MDSKSVSSPMNYHVVFLLELHAANGTLESRFHSTFTMNVMAKEVERLNEQQQCWHTYKFSSFDGLVQLRVTLVLPRLNIPYSPETKVRYEYFSK
jgi:hypothetical protein